MVTDLVTTIIPVFNRAAQLREAVASVLHQDWRPIEIIIVDDGSTDETPALASELVRANGSLIRAESQRNSGPGAARERGRRLAKGEFIQYLDSDDVLMPGKFRAQVEALRANPDAHVAYGITYFRDSRGFLDDLPHKGTGLRQTAMFPSFLVSRWWETATPLYRKSITDQAGRWTSLRLEEDWEYDCRIASLGARLAWVPQPVSEHRDHPGLRLSRGSELDQSRMRDRAKSHDLIFGHAMRAGIPLDSPEMMHFARALFLLSRQCGAANLPTESQLLFYLSRQASGSQRGQGIDFRLYRVLAALLGWQGAGKASRLADRIRAQS